MGAAHRKVARFVALAVAILLTAQAAHAADVTGKWTSQFESQIGSLKYVYDLKTEGDKITGKAIREADGQKTETELIEGKLSGDDVSFVETLDFDGNQIRIEYKGKVSGQEMKLTRVVGDFSTLEIVAKREGASTTAPAVAATKIKLSVVKVDSEETTGEPGQGANAVDGNPDTFWHTQWEGDNPPHPHEIIIELAPPSRIKGITYLPRQDIEVNGTIRDYELYLSDDGKEFGQPVAKGALAGNQEKKTISFDVKQAKFIKLKALSEINDNPWTTAAEIEVVAE
jgi:hypothetical protein